MTVLCLIIVIFSFDNCLGGQADSYVGPRHWYIQIK